MLELRVYNQQLELLGIVDVYDSVVWTRNYQTPSTLDVTCAASVRNLAMLKRHNIIEHSDSTECVFIESISLKEDDSGSNITLTCSSITKVLYNRVSSNSSTSLLELINTHCIQSSDPNRNIPKLTTLGVDREVALLEQTIGARIEDSARANGWGLYSYVDHTNKQIVITSYEGKDRTVAQIENPRVVFSSEYDNLLSCSYSESDSGAVNTPVVILTVPPGLEPCTPPTYDYPSSYSGYARIESVVKVTAKTYDDIETISGEGFSFDLTRSYLDIGATQRDMKAACEGQTIEPTSNFEGSVSNTCGYKKTWNLGDIVTVENATWGVVANNRIEKVTEVYEMSKIEVIPTFGTPKISLISKIKKIR